MYGFLLTILVLNGIFLTVIILLQAGKGGGLAAMGGGAAATEGVLGGRQATTFLTRATWVSGTVFMVLSLVLAILSSRAQDPTLILQQDLQTPTAPAPAVPGTQDAPAGGDGPAGAPAAPEGTPQQP